MRKEKHYAVLGYRGDLVCSIWATSVAPKDIPSEGFWFKRGREIVAGCSYGYKDMQTHTMYYPPSPDTHLPHYAEAH